MTTNELKDFTHHEIAARQKLATVELYDEHVVHESKEFQ